MSTYELDVERYARTHFRVASEGEGKLTLRCPIDPGAHSNGDAKPSAVLFLDTGLVNCAVCGNRYLDELESLGYPPAPRKPDSRPAAQSGGPKRSGGCSPLAAEARKALRLGAAGSEPAQASLPDPGRIEAASQRLDCPQARAFLQSRGLTLETARRFRFGWHRDGNGREFLLIPSLRDGKCVNFKLRRGDEARPGESKYPAQHKGGAKALWNIDSVAKGSQAAVVIAEGELDAATISQALGEEAPVVSVTLGAGVFPAAWVEELERRGVREIIWAFDDDDPGHEAVAKHLARFDRSVRQRRCTFPGAKDANAWLVRRLEEGAAHEAAADELRAILRDAPDIGPGGCMTTMGALERLRRQRLDQGISDNHTPWRGINEHFRRWDPGEILGVLAYPKVGKSTFAMQLVHHRWRSLGETALVYYAEDRIEHAVLRLMCQHLRIGQEDFLKSMDAYLNKPEALKLSRSDRVWYCDAVLDGQEDYPEMLRELIRYTGAQIVLFDHFHQILQPQDNFYVRQAALARRFSEVAAESGARLVLVLQPNKEDRREWKCSSSCISGAADIKAVIQHILCLSRKTLRKEEGREILSECALAEMGSSRWNRLGDAWIDLDPKIQVFGDSD